MPPDFDVVIVGAGIAGLAAAWSLRDLNICVLESTEVVGGRLRTATRGPHWLNLGAHVLMDGGPMARLAREVGVPLIEPPGSFLSVAVRDQVIRARSAPGMFLRLPLSLAARMSLAKSYLRILRARSMLPRTLEGISFGDLLGRMHPDAEALMRVVANRLTGELDEISAYVGVHGFAHLWLGSRLNIVGGSAELPRALQNALKPRVITGAHVRRVLQRENTVEIEYQEVDKTSRITARTCILAIPAPCALQVLHAPTKEVEEALLSVKYTPFVVAGFFTGEATPMPWDDIYALAAPNRSFCMVFNPGNALIGLGPRKPGGALVVYAVARRAASLLDLSDVEIQGRFLRDLADIFPEVKGVVREVVIQRWPLGTATGFPGRSSIVDRLAAGLGSLAFAGDYMMPLDGADASESGFGAADTIRRTLLSKSMNAGT